MFTLTLDSSDLLCIATALLALVSGSWLAVRIACSWAYHAGHRAGYREGSEFVRSITMPQIDVRDAEIEALERPANVLRREIAGVTSRWN